MTHGLSLDPEVGEALVERTQTDRCLEARELGTEAVVRSGREREVVSGVLAGDVEGVGVGEHVRVAVGSAEQHDDPAAARQVRAGHLDVLARHPPGELHGGVEAQHLLDGQRPPLGFPPEQFPLLGVLVQQHDSGTTT